MKTGKWRVFYILIGFGFAAIAFYLSTLKKFAFSDYVAADYGALGFSILSGMCFIASAIVRPTSDR
jgi:hypothetical protein